jgi:ribosomal protein L19E
MKIYVTVPRILGPASGKTEKRKSWEARRRGEGRREGAILAAQLRAVIYIATVRAVYIPTYPKLRASGW